MRSMGRQECGKIMAGGNSRLSCDDGGDDDDEASPTFSLLFILLSLS